MKISLDRIALRALVDSDPKFELDLKNAVLSEIGRRFFEKESSRVIREAGHVLFEKALSAYQSDEDFQALVNKALEQSLIKREGGWFRKVSLTAEMQAEIDEAVAIAKHNAVTIAEKSFNDAVLKVVAERLESSDLEERIEKRFNRLTNEEINRRVSAAFEERLSEIRSALS